MVADLKGAGFEVGVHGLYHDGHDLESRERLMERLPEIRDYAERWGAAGFRSPATHRRWEWMGLLGFDYDSSFPDTDPYEPQPGGCCSWLPFFIDDLVELPITLPQDHTLFEILRHADASVWSAKAGLIRERGGMALILTHPDYMTDERLCSTRASWQSSPMTPPPGRHCRARSARGGGDVMRPDSRGLATNGEWSAQRPRRPASGSGNRADASASRASRIRRQQPSPSRKSAARPRLWSRGAACPAGDGRRVRRPRSRLTRSRGWCPAGRRAPACPS